MASNRSRARRWAAHLGSPYRVACVASIACVTAVLAISALPGCASGDLLNFEPPAAGGDPSDAYLVVDCLLPPQMIRQGERSVRFTPSRPAKISARLCAQQGGAQKAGIDVWRSLAESGNVEAQTYLGEMYENGTGGVAQDTRQAIAWYTRAANAGQARAITNLALLYANGAPGVKKDPAKAAVLVKQSIATTGVDTRQIVVVPTGAGRPLPVADTQERVNLKDFPFGNYHALLIGNSDYLHIPKLNSPVHEVDAIASLLERRYGFRTTKLKNATRDQILKALDDLDGQLKASDNLLVYYTGHGAESETKEGYWIPVDGEGPTSTNRLRIRLWVSSSDLRERLSIMAPRHVLVVSDSCYSARFLQFRGVFSPVAETQSRLYLQNFAKLYSAKSRTALTSGGLAPVVEPNDGSNMSLFAKAFIQFLERNRDAVPSVHIFSGIELEVMTATSRLGVAQQPQWGPITGSGHESGDFWFRPR